MTTDAPPAAPSLLPTLDLVAASESPKTLSRALRELARVRHAVTRDQLAAAVATVYSPVPAYFVDVLGSLDENMDASLPTPALALFIHLAVQLHLLDTAQLPAAAAFSAHVVALLTRPLPRLVDPLAAKCWFYVARTAELQGDTVLLRPAMHAALRTATLRHDDETRAALIALLLRALLVSHDPEQAANLVANSEFPDGACLNGVAARYFLYLAKLHAAQLDYSAAHDCVVAAIRKAPQTQHALGFHQAATKLLVVVELLMGDVPELEVFVLARPLVGSTNAHAQRACLQPYRGIARAVRAGDLQMFGEQLRLHEERLKRDGTYTLVSRLRQNVIKTGIRTLLLVYLKISLKDICIKLHLDSEEAAEYVVAKAVRDGVIDAVIDPVAGAMALREVADVYLTAQPQAEFDRRIRFCNMLHNESVKGMQFPMSTNRVDLKAHLAASEAENELLKALQESDFDDGYF